MASRRRTSLLMCLGLLLAKDINAFSLHPTGTGSLLMPYRNNPALSPSKRRRSVEYSSRNHDTTNQIQQRQTTTQLSLSLTNNHPASLAISASLALIGSSCVGLQFDKLVPSSGILATLVTAAMLSNLGIVPSSHYIYDLCWTTFLPASLALLLLAYRNNQEKIPIPGSSSSSSPTVTTRTIQQEQEPVAKSIRTVALPFFISSIGSLVGCLTSFVLFSRLPSLGLSLTDAQVACACLSASLVGGSVNFFATAQLISASPTLLGSLATSDLMVSSAVHNGIFHPPVSLV
jgi:hypothetical protein